MFWYNITYKFPFYCNVKDDKFKTSGGPARGDSLKDYPAPAYNKVGQPCCR